MDKADLERVRDWAIQRLATGAEPPWSWYQLMKLREATEAILEGMEVMRPMAYLRESEQRQDAALRLVDSGGRQETARRHSVPRRIPLPT